VEGLAPQPGDERLHYLYGFVESSAPVPDLEGVEPGAPVFAIAAGGVACVVSTVPAGDYRQSGSWRDERWLAPRALRHHAVLCALHGVTTVLPLRFGALCAGRDDVRALMAERREALGDLLSAFRGKDEWTLRIAADAGAIADRVERESPAVIDMHARAQALPAGQAYFLRKQHGHAVAALVSQTIAGFEAALIERLGLAVVRGRRTAAPASAEMAVLVDRDGLGAVKAALADLETDAAWCALHTTLIGPWPAYRFVPAALGAQLGRE